MAKNSQQKPKHSQILKDYCSPKYGHDSMKTLAHHQHHTQADELAAHTRCHFSHLKEITLTTPCYKIVLEG